jgi:hypothetical protein
VVFAALEKRAQKRYFQPLPVIAFSIAVATPALLVF